MFVFMRRWESTSFPTTSYALADPQSTCSYPRMVTSGGVEARRAFDGLLRYVASRWNPQQRIVVLASFDPSPQPMERHRCELHQGRYTDYIVGLTPAAPQPGMGMDSVRDPRSPHEKAQQFQATQRQDELEHP